MIGHKKRGKLIPLLKVSIYRYTYEVTIVGAVTSANGLSTVEPEIKPAGSSYSPDIVTEYP